MGGEALRGLLGHPEAEVAWAAHVRELTDSTLLPRADSWYVGANIPGKRKEALIYPGGTPMYLDQCNQSAANGYSGFLLE